MKKFVKNIISFSFIILTIVGLVNYAYESHLINYGSMGDKKNDSAYIVEVPDKIQICNFGNSHGYYGFDYSNYEDDYTCFNFSLPSQSMSYNYQILDNYKDSIDSGATVFICVSYTSFYGKSETSSSDFSAKNKRYYHFLDKEHIKEYDRSTAFFVKWLPVLTSPNWVDLLKTVIGINESTDVWFWVTNEQEAVEHGMKRYQSHVAGNVDEKGKRIINYEEINAVYKMIELCHQIGATPILITTPYLAEYTDAVKNNDSEFYPEFYGQINKILDETNVEYYDYQFDSRFRNNYDVFMNTDHLNKNGAQIFTDILMDDIYFKTK